MQTRSASALPFVLAAIACIACDDEEPSAATEEQAEPAPEVPEDLLEAAGIEPAPSAWPEDVVDLAGSLEAVQSVGSCRERLRAQMPVEVAEVMADLAYAQVIDDTCAGLVAVRDRSAEGCDALSVSATRRGCRQRLALVAGEPLHCPESAVTDGRDPVCVAWAARDPALCKSAGAADRARCRAVLSGNEDDCRSSRGGERARCEAEIQRYTSSLGDERVESAAADVTPVFRLTAEVERSGSAGEPIAIEHAGVEQGVYLAARGCAHRLSLTDGSATPSPVSFTDRPPVAELEVDVPVGAELPLVVPLGATTAALRVRLPGIGEATSIAGADGNVTITEWSTERGSLVAARIEGELALTPGRVRIRGELRTFVRDLDAPDCPGGVR